MYSRLKLSSFNAWYVISTQKEQNGFKMIVYARFEIIFYGGSTHINSLTCMKLIYK